MPSRPWRWRTTSKCATSVRSRSSRARQRLAAELERAFPQRFIPRYSMVMFHPEISYTQALQRGQQQQHWLDQLIAQFGDGPLRPDALKAAAALINQIGYSRGECLIPLKELKTPLRVLLLPPAGPLLLAFIGLLMLARRPRLGRALIAIGLIGLWLLSTPWVADRLTQMTERYPALDWTRPTGAQAIVILGGGGQRAYAPEELLVGVTLRRPVAGRESPPCDGGDPGERTAAPEAGAECLPHVAHLAEVSPNKRVAKRGVVGSEGLVRFWGGERAPGGLGRQATRLDRVVDALEGRHVHEAHAVAGEQKPRRMKAARQRDVPALGDRLCSPGDPLAALEDRPDRRGASSAPAAGRAPKAPRRGSRARRRGRS